MKHVHLGRSGVRVSELCLGTMNFGMVTDEAESFRIMDAALDAQVNFFATANMYGGGGGTEEILGRWFSGDQSRRDKVVLATKVYGGRSPWPNTGKLSAFHIRQAVEDSLRRMHTDHIDLYQFHHVDRETPWDEIWQAMDTLITQGKVTYVGSSNFAAWNIAQANETAKQRGSLGLISEQSLYNLNARMVELEVLPACEAYGVGVIPWSPLGGGILGGALEKADSGRRANERTQRTIENNRPQLEAWESLCRDLGEQPADVALAWLLHQPAVTSPIIGPRTLEQFTTSLRACDIELDEGALGKIDTIFPGPGGQAPEAYAW
jgi:aryl-alcohol dehydrogenase-like predicted oxidoreductase